MFTLNEAPKLVLAAISSEKQKRGCGLFWSVLCCVPTFGASIGVCNDDFSTPKNWSGCYPHPVKEEINVTLDLLIEKLHGLKVKQSELKNNPVDIHKVIEWQVRSTITLLNTVVNENIIQGSYLTALKNTLQTLQIKASQDEKYSKILSEDKAPLINHETYVPSYTMKK